MPSKETEDVAGACTFNGRKKNVKLPKGEQKNRTEGKKTKTKITTMTMH